MGFWDKLFGKGKEKEPAMPPQPSRPAERAESPDERINRLWESAKKLGWSDADREKAVSTYTELLGLVDENSTSYNVAAIFRNRAMSYRSLKKYDAALEDLTKDLEIAQRRGDRLRVLECQKLIEETRAWKREAEITASGGEKAAKFQAMDQQGHMLWRTESEADTAFESLFADLENDDPDVRAQASRLLADAPNAVRRLISIYQGCLTSDPRRASLAGRVLGRKIAKGSDDMIPTQIAQMMYGIAVSFIPCPCVHCGHFNRGIAAPPSGPMVPYYHQEDDQGAYAVPVLCDKCGKEFFVV